MTDEVRRPSPIVLRLTAAIVDFTLLVIVLLPIELIWTQVNNKGQTVPTPAANWAALAIFAAYPIVCLARYGRSGGKYLCSLRVTRPDGAPCGWLRSIVRFVVSFAPLGVAGAILPNLDQGAVHSLVEIAQVVLTLGIYGPILFDEQRRGIHDRLAGTVVTTHVPALVRAAFPPPATNGHES